MRWPVKEWYGVWHREFLLFPREIGDQVVWLETVEFMEEILILGRVRRTYRLLK